MPKMMRLLVPMPLVLSLAGLCLGEDAKWKPAAGPLMTRWAKEVSPDSALPEYPRPQMVRKRWQCLNGLWDYAIRPKDAEKPAKWDGKILVPFPCESALSGVMKKVGLPNCGTLPDFGNFRVSKTEEYDRYEGTKELMPFAKGVSAKSYDFDEAGNETTIDYPRIIKIVLDAGYRGHIGVEYEGSRLSEHEGIRATKKLLERVRGELS